jgi:hypothetical protein
MRDLVPYLHPVRAISPATALADNTPLVSQIVDRRGFDSVGFVILIGQVATPAATFAVTLQHGNSATLADAAAVPAAQLSGTLAAASFNGNDDDKLRKLGYLGNRRYLRLTVTPSGNAGAANIAAVAVLGHPYNGPTPNPPG